MPMRGGTVRDSAAIARKRDELANADTLASVHLAVDDARKTNTRRAVLGVVFAALGLAVVNGQVVSAAEKQSADQRELTGA